MIRRRWMMIALTGMIALHPVCVSAEEPTTDMYVCVEDGHVLRGRTKPSVHSTIDARFANGDTVAVYEIAGQWARVRGGESGTVWCYADYLSTVPALEEPEEYTVRANGRVRIRKKPDGVRVRWAYDGDTVTVTRKDGPWAYVGDGYILGRFLEGYDEEPGVCEPD